MLAVAAYRAELADEEGSRPIELVELPDPRPGAGEVLVAVRASALNRADLLQMRGLYPPPEGEPETPGLECSGEVIELGDGVEELKVGDRIMALLAGGGHATRAVVPVGQAMPIPPDLDFAEAAAIPEVGLTAWTNLVYEGGLQRGQSVLITAAASGVGTFAAQLAHELGARVLVAGRSLERLEVLRSLGADETLQLGEDLARRVRAANDGAGVDLVIDLVGGDGLSTHLACLRPQGRLVLVGVLGGAQGSIDLGDVLRRRLRIVGSVLRARSRAEKAGLVASFHEFAASRLAEGSLRPVIDRVVPFAEVADAYRTFADDPVLGKIVLQMPSDQG